MKKITAANIKTVVGEPRRTFVAEVKGIDLEARTIRAYASTNAWDRYGERFEADAFKEGLENYKKNPVILFGHNYYEAPIAKTIKYEFDAKGLILTMKFAETPKANEVFELYKGGFMSAFSVGFRPLEIAFEERAPGEMGAVFKKAELLENSAVPVPANPEAVVMKGAGAETRTMAGVDLREIIETAFRSMPIRSEDTDPEEHPEAAVPAPAPAAAPLETPALTPAAPENAAAGNGEAPKSLKTVLGYLLTLGKTVEGKNAIKNEDVKSLAVQANNLLRELVLGTGAEPLSGGDGDMTDDQAISLVREYEMLSEQASKKGFANDKDREQFIALGKSIEKLISQTVAS